MGGIRGSRQLLVTRLLSDVVGYNLFECEVDHS